MDKIKNIINLKKDKKNKEYDKVYNGSNVIIFMNGVSKSFEFNDQLAADAFVNMLRDQILQKKDYIERSETMDILKGECEGDTSKLDLESDYDTEERTIVFLRNVQAITAFHYTKYVKKKEVNKDA